MTAVIEWQPFVTLYHNSNEIIQHESLWLDTNGYSHAVLDVLMPRLTTNGHLYIETSESLDGPWHDTEAGLSETSSSQQVVLARDLPRNDSSCLRRYLRWRSDSIANKEVCFRIVAQLNR